MHRIPDGPMRRHRHLRKHLFVGIALIAVGAVLMLGSLGYIGLPNLMHLWPALIALSGMLYLLAPSYPGQWIKGVARIALAGSMPALNTCGAGHSRRPGRWRSSLLARAWWHAVSSAWLGLDAAEWGNEPISLSSATPRRHRPRSLVYRPRKPVR
jgi:hypothetical protein